MKMIYKLISSLNTMFKLTALEKEEKESKK